MRVLAVDYGDTRTGIAISDPTGFLAGETTVITAYRPDVAAQGVAELAKSRKVDRIVVGRPLNMNGTFGERAQKCEDFAALLRELTGLEVALWDERLTSVDANRILSDAGKKRSKQRERVDAVAASLILEGYLGFLKRNG